LGLWHLCFIDADRRMNLQVLVNFEVVDESLDWIVVHKPAPLIVHPANRQAEPTLLGGLEQLLAYEVCNGASLGIITRLDRETSGLVLVAKNLQAARELGWVFERREARKEYLAIVRGWPSQECWECHEPILRAAELGPSAIWVRQIASPTGRSCQTGFRVEHRFERAEGKFTLVRCFPKTGRMHQIRVHLAISGFPILGDKLYSGDGTDYLEWMDKGWTPELEKRLILPRHALHAARLEVPWQKGWLAWEAELSPELLDFMENRPSSPRPDLVIWNRLG
jgi:23S rRNA pseudouridine1911/1915/1917 synthase